MKAVTFAFVSLVLCGAARADSITVSVVDNVVTTLPIASTGSGTSAPFACVGTTLDPQGCVYTAQPSNSLTTPLGTAQSSASASTSPSIVLTAQGSVTASGSAATAETLGESSNYSLGFTYVPPIPNEFTIGLYPSVLVNFLPDANQTGYVQVGVNEGLLELYFTLNGSVPASFSLDTATGLMTLYAPSGDVGSLLSPSGVIFTFANGVLTQSNSMLGFAPRAVGSPANFVVGYSPLLELAQGGFSGPEFAGASEEADLTTIPEPASFALTLGALVALLCGSSLHRRFRRA